MPPKRPATIFLSMRETEIPANRISLTVNGQPRTLSPGTTISGLLAALQLNPQLVVVELNRNIVRDRGSFATTTLDDGDTLELVHFVGGG